MKDTLADYISIIILAAIVGIACGVLAFKFSEYKMLTKIEVLEKTCRVVL